MTKSDDQWDWGDMDEPKTFDPVEPISPRERVLLQAVEAITKQRNNTYGPPTQDFDRIANALTALGFRFDPHNDGGQNGGALEGHHVAMIQIVLKLSRATWSPAHEDNWIDIAGYAGCGFECVEDK